MPNLYFLEYNYIILGNSLFEFAFERDGRLRWIINKLNGENYIKNHYNRWILKVLDADRKELKLEKPTFLWKESKLHIIYRDHLDAEIVIEVFPDNPESIWTLKIKNTSSHIMDIIFPHISGIYLGNTWKDNYLVYPYIAGERLKNPIETLAGKSSKIIWDWQDYKYTYIVDGVGTVKDGDLFVRELPYTGPLSMAWLDYYNENVGFYLASYDEDKTLTYLRIETPGPEYPGMGFSFRKRSQLSSGEEGIFKYGIGIHSGDWHWGADRYRKWFNRTFPKVKTTPEWLMKSSGLVAHYDFRYQSGISLHNFDDIPILFEKAKKSGFDHLFISGWNKNGFDNGYPLYIPDERLGGEKRFRGKILETNSMGGHITTYINVRIVNTAHTDKVPKDVLTNHIERYGAVDFYVADPSKEEWQNLILETIERLINYGVSGVYLDELSMAPALEDIPNWIKGYTELLDKIVKKYNNKVFIIEGCSDMYGRYVDLQLVSTFFYWHTSYPELFRYTFPEYMLVDMLYPDYQTMRPSFVSMISKDLISRAFITGMYPWIYDLTLDNSFDNSEGLRDYLNHFLKLRLLGINFFNSGQFLDDLNLKANGNIRAKLYKKDDQYMIAVWNKDNVKGELELKSLKPPFKIKVISSSESSYKTNNNIVDVPKEVLSLIFIKEGK
ncbi:MAG: DUF6259 domain-containing protein [bacterium]|nr:DUF6259 domain-containing protein [bacterium]